MYIESLVSMGIGSPCNKQANNLTPVQNTNKTMSPGTQGNRNQIDIATTFLQVQMIEETIFPGMQCHK